MNDKVVIVGAGRVGSTFANALAVSGLAQEIVLIDADRARAEGEAMDIAHAVPFFPPVRVRAGSLADAVGAAVTVVAAGAAQRAGEARPALLRRNVEILRGIVPEVVRANPEGLLLIATNPVDALTFAALRMSGLPPERVFGSGTVLDTARLRAELSQHYGVDARNVHAYVLGEHGDSEIVAWSTASLANVQIQEYCGLTGMSCTPEDMDAIAVRVREAAYEIIRRKGATNFAIAAALTRIVEAVVRHEASVLTVSTLIDGHYGIRDVCLSLPAIVDRSGIRRVLPVPLSDDERERLRASANAVRAVIESAGFAETRSTPAGRSRGESRAPKARVVK
ncbi:MAG: L-lactate dehydrogenase [Burkholderiales bacterium]